MRKIKEILGWLGYYAIGSRLPDSHSRVKLGQKRFRRACAKGFCASIGKDVNIERKAILPRTLHLGDRSGIGKNAYIQGETHIGDDVMMGPECHIWTINHETADTTIPMDQQGAKPERPVWIGNDVWIGDRVTILPGVRIGNGAIVGAGAVVTRDVPDFAVVAGNPATVVKYRNETK